MTLSQPVRSVVKRTIDEDVVPDDVVLAVEDDEELHHLAEAIYQLELVGDCGAESDTPAGLHSSLISSTQTLADRRVRQLIEQAGAVGGST